MSNSLFETKDYYVSIGVSPFVSPPGEGRETPAAYIITNNNTKLVEGEHRVLGMVIRMAKEMQDLLDSELEQKQEQVDLLPEMAGATVTP